MNWQINTTLSVNFIIKNTEDLFNKENNELLNYGDNIQKKRLIIIDNNVFNIYSFKIKDYLDHHHFNYNIIVLNGDEKEKNIQNLLYLLEEMEHFGIQRKNEPVICIGGGVVLDIAGLACALYRRGVPYIRIPTTLLGIVDVSLAAKTGINFKDRRNRLGSYYPPVATLLDKSFLETLTEIEISSALGEIIKIAVIKDYNLFTILEHYGRDLFLSKFKHPYADEVINRSIRGMKEELENNLWEKNLERCVDFGHSFSPIIEMKSLVNAVQELTHGQAVALDIIFSCIISHIREGLTEDDVRRVINVCKKCNLPTYHEYFTKPRILLEALSDTIKHRDGNQNLPIPIEIGKYVFINNLTYDEINKTINYYIEINE